MLRVTASFWPLVVAASIWGCAGSAQNTTVHSGPEDSPAYAALDGEATADGSLPRYLTLEVRAEGLWLDGERVAPSELEERLSSAAKDPTQRGVAVIFYVSDQPAPSLLARVARAGFTHVVISGLSPESFAQAEASDPAPAEYAAPPVSVELEPQASAPAASSEAAVQEEAPASPEAPGVLVKHYGLHIGGGPNTDAEREQYLGPIAKRFDDLQQCHALAKQQKLQASFGVDLLVGEKGGRAKIRDYRTQLDGKDFQLCVLGVLGDISFPAPGRATVVSYSVLFKPVDP